MTPGDRRGGERAHRDRGVGAVVVDDARDRAGGPGVVLLDVEGAGAAARRGAIFAREAPGRERVQAIARVAVDAAAVRRRRAPEMVDEIGGVGAPHRARPGAP